MTPHTALWMLRRLAPRAIRVLTRHQETEVGIAAFAMSLGVHAPAYIDAYDNLRRFTKRRMEEHSEAKKALDELLYKIRIWAPQVARDIDHVVAGDFGENPDVPDDTISDGKSLVEHVTKRAEEGKEPLPYTEILLEDLGNTLAKAEAEWNEAEQAQAEFRTLRLEVREVGTALEQDLVAFRKALRTVIGSAHPDYQKLRLEKIRTPDADDDEVGASLPPDADTTDDEDVLPSPPPAETQPADAPPAP